MKDKDMKKSSNPSAVSADDLKATKDEKFNSKGKRGKFKSKFGKNDSRMKNKGKFFNDTTWHTKNEQLVKDSASLPFNVVVGNLLNSGAVNKVGLPIILSATFDWTVGVAQTMKDSINSAAAQIWQFLRSYNSGSTNYEAADVIMYIFGSLDICSTLQWLIRPFGIYKYYSDRNREVPRIIFNEMGIDYDDFVNNLAKYRGILNTYLAKSSSLVIPKEYPIFDQVMAMTKDIYKDEDSDSGREQLYIINKAVFHNYDPTATPTGGVIEVLPDQLINSSGNGLEIITSEVNWVAGQPLPKYKVYLDIFQYQLEAIVLDEDCNIIAGDMLKAYDRKGTEFWRFDMIDENYIIEPKYDPEFVMMWHNAEFVQLYNGVKNLVSDGSGIFDNGENVSVIAKVGSHEAYNNQVNQNNNLISTNTFFYWPSGTANIDRFNLPRLIDTNSMNPDPVENMMRTRWKNRWKGTNDSGNNVTKYEPTALSSIILFNPHIIVNRKVGTSPETYVRYEVPTSFQVASTMPVNYFEALGLLSAFDMHHIVYLDDLVAGGGGITDSMPSGQLNNVVPVRTEDLADIHQIDFLSLLNIPFNR